MLRTLEADQRPATSGEQQTLARFAGWGALPHLFHEASADWATLREQIRPLLSETEWAQARASTINAHYTDRRIVAEMWRHVTALGITDGRVFEPGCGSGNFLGIAPQPERFEFVGVELDAVTARIAKALYPQADIRNEAIERARLPEDWFELAIGNVPFAQHFPYDPVHNAGGFSLHNYAIYKAARLTRPGGYIAMITSAYSMDAATTSWREAMSEICDFAGAVRLPSGAHQDTAGTQVVTDIVLFRRRPSDAEPRHVGEFRDVMTVAVDGGTVSVNEWFAANPQFVVGEMTSGRGMYRDGQLLVDGPTGADLAIQLRQAFHDLEALAPVRELAAREEPAPDRPAGVLRPRTALAPSDVKDGAFHVVDGSVARARDGAWETHTPRFKKDAPELRSLIALRDAAVGVLRLEAATPADTDELAEARVLLNRRYDAYHRSYGPIARPTLTPVVDDDTGATSWRRRNPSMGGFRSDPDFPILLALEHYDEETATATKAAIFSRRVIAPSTSRHEADSPSDALAICLNELGRVDLDHIAGLLHTEPDQVPPLLDGRIYLDPATEQWETAEAYLSGNVRTKLAAAHTAAASDDRYRANVTALAATVPADLAPEEIDVGLGAPWVPAAVIAEFAQATLGCRDINVNYVPATADWTVTVPSWQRYGVLLTAEWGTSRKDAIDLLDACLNQVTVNVYDTDPDGRRIKNATETLLAVEKQDKLRTAFSEWVWKDPLRAETLARIYNDRFNSTIVGTWDGSHLTFPGLAAGFTPHPHQRDAVWRVVSGGNTLLAHEVGAGKTATMCMAAMELRRLGLAAKPVLVVPNHMLEQFTREFLQLYPAANLLVATKDDTTRDERKTFVARVATGDWDAVIMTQQTFARIPVSTETHAAFVNDRLDELRALLTSAAETEGLGAKAVKKIEKRIAHTEAGLAKLLDVAGRDDGAVFEQTGVDYVFCDEAHHYKNRRVITNIQGVGTVASKRAEDLAMKLAWLHDRQPARQTCFATGTPVANSIAEMFTMQTYLQPDRLTELGINCFDAWAANFATTVTAIELSPDGGSYRTATRFARFQNVPDLLRIYREIADIKRGDELGLQRPALHGGKATTITVPASNDLEAFVASLVERAELIRNRQVQPEDDNMLKVTGDGRRAALDLRLVGHTAPRVAGKIAACAEQVATIYHQHHDRPYLDPATRQPHPRPGAAQIVFCDLGTPGGASWNAYNELRRQLVQRGVPEGQVRFIHDAPNDEAKARLFSEARNGLVSVLVGSTEKMGVGTNIQDRLIALHHLDAPWRPADLEQRDGRILRPGNQNAEVHVFRYVTQGSFDVYMWQTLERKATFIGQLQSARLDTRSIEDITADTALSYGEVKALATGNPLVLEKAQLETELHRLRRLEAGWKRERASVAQRIEHYGRRIGELERIIEQCDDATTRRIETRGDRFRAVIDGHTYTERRDAGDALYAALDGATSLENAGYLGGFAFSARWHDDELIVTFDHPAVQRVRYTDDEWRTLSPHAAVRRVEDAIVRVDTIRANAVGERDRLVDDLGIAERHRHEPFAQHQRLSDICDRMSELDNLLTLPTVDALSVTIDAAGPAAMPDLG